MEKGVIRLVVSSYAIQSMPLEWYSDKTIKKYENFPKSLFLKPDCEIYGNKLSRHTNFIAYRCENCGAVLIIPPDNDYDRDF